MVGAAKKVKLAVESTKPARLATVTLPVIPAPTTAVIWVPSELTVKLEATVPPNLTLVRSEKLMPVIVTEVPCPPVLGVKSVIVGTNAEVLLEMYIWPLFIVGLRSFPGLLLSTSPVFERVRETVPLAPVVLTYAG